MSSGIQLSEKRSARSTWLPWALAATFFVLGIGRGAKLLTWVEVVVLVPTFWLMVTRRVDLRSLLTPLLLGFLLYVLFFDLAMLWAHEPPPEGVGYVLRISFVSLGVFLAVMIAVRDLDGMPRLGRRVMVMLVVLGGVLAVASLVDYYLAEDHGINRRLHALGSARHPIIGMYYYAFPMAVSLVALARIQGPFRVVLVFSMVAVFLVFTMSFSRGPMIGLLAMGGVFLYSRLSRRNMLYVAVGAAVVLAILLWKDVDRWVFERGLSWRPEIWLGALRAVTDAVWFGHGNDIRNIVHSAVVPSGKLISWHGHNIWVSHLFWGGITAAALLAGIMLAAVRVLWRMREQAVAETGLLLLVFANVALLTDGNVLIAAPGPLWFIFLVPVAFAAALQWPARLPCPVTARLSG